MSNSWDEYADGWDTNADVQRYAKLAFDSLVKRIDINGLRILDFGCGTGLLTERLAPKCPRLVAIDPSEKMTRILQAKKIDNLTVINDYLTAQAILAHTELQQPFDLIVASSVCAFLPDYPETLKTISSLLTPSGHFVQWDWAATDNESDFGLSIQSIEQAFSASGLKKVEIENAFTMQTKDNSAPVIMALGVNSIK